MTGFPPTNRVHVLEVAADGAADRYMVGGNLEGWHDYYLAAGCDRRPDGVLTRAGRLLVLAVTDGDLPLTLTEVGTQWLIPL